MADNITLNQYNAQSAGVYPAGTTMATKQNADLSHSQRVVIDGVLSSSDPLAVDVISATTDPDYVGIVDTHGHWANVQQISSLMDGDEYGLITNSVIHGVDAHGDWKDVKVSHAGALTVEVEDGGNSITVDGSVTITRGDDFFSDAFQRLRVSNTNQRLDVEFLYDKQPLLFDEIVNAPGTATHNAQSRDVTLAIGGTSSSDVAGLYQHYYNPYTPGNSQFVAITGVLNGANLAGTASVFRRSYATSDVTEETISQSSWIGATSGVNWNYSQIFLIDFQSLKIGRIRFALDRGGIAVPVATMENDNERATGYWQMANAPVFWRIYNSGANVITEFGYGDQYNAVGWRYTATANSAQTARAICATVKSEGGGELLDIAGYKFGVGNGATTRTVTNAFLPVLSIQLKTTFGAGTNRGLVIPQSLSLQCDQPIYYEVRVNPTLTNSNFGTVSADSLCNFDVAASALSGGRVIAAGYASSGSTRAGATQIALIGKAPLSVNYAGTAGDILTVACIRTTTTSAATGAALEWKEVR